MREIYIYLVLGVLVSSEITEVNINCARGNGFYVIGCNSTFYRCHENNPIPYECPVGLFFNPSRSKCDYKEEVMVCKESGSTTNVIKASEMFSCANRTDGSYSDPENPCDTQYFTCSYGRTIPQICPYNQWFNEQLNRCDHKENVAPCNMTTERSNDYSAAPASLGYDSVSQQKLDEQEELSTPSTTTIEVTNATMNDQENTPKCQDLPDGVYRDVIEKCASHFWKCANHEAFKYECQDQLFYDAEMDKCEYKENIPDCGGVRPSEMPALDHHQYEIDFNCTGKVDGFYEKDRCQNRFYSCTGGVARELNCSANLVFDTRIRACDYPNACNRERTTPQPPVIGGDHGNLGVTKPTSFKFKFDCAGKKDGYYALEKCAGNYVQCITENPYLLSCPSGLLFNDYTGQCDYKMKCNEVLVNTSPPSTTKLTTTVPISTSSESIASQMIMRISHAISDIIKPTPTEPPVIASSAHDLDAAIVPSCANLTNGAHASASCSEKFVECWDGTTTQARCQAGLVFNQYNGQCDYKRNVPDCNSGMEFPLFLANKSIDIRDISLINEIVGEKATNDPYCEHLSDGIHGSGCQNFFYWCDKGIAYKKFCPSDLFFDSRSTKCDYRKKIADCTTRKNSTNAQNYSPFYQPYMSSSVAVAPKRMDRVEEKIESPTTFDCSGKEDGLYAYHYCTALFTQCWNNNPVPHSCQEGLFYNEKNGMCDYKENVPSCSGISPQTIPTTSNLRPAKVYAEGVKPGSEHLCNGKSDGYYSNGCSSKYYACISQVYYPMNCHADLKFSEESKKCDFEYRVSECNAAGLAPANPFTDIAGNKVMIVPPTIKKTVPFSCLYKSDGFYGVEKCSPNYASCQQGQMAIGTCVSPLIFNPVNGKCDLISNIEQCQIEGSTSATAAAVFQELSQSAISCEGRPFGWYAISPCSPEWLSCTASGSTRGNCWGGRVFNPINKLCSPRANVAGCNSTPPQMSSQPYRMTSETPFIPDMKQATPNYRNQALQPIEQAMSDYSSLSIFCQEKNDGIYQLGCQATYLVCSDRSAYPFSCPEGMVYNQIKSSCDHPYRVSECTTNKFLQQF